MGKLTGRIRKIKCVFLQRQSPQLYAPSLNQRLHGRKRENVENPDERARNDEKAPRNVRERETGSWECGAVMGHFRWSPYTPHMPSQSDCDHGAQSLLSVGETADRPSVSSSH